MAIEPTDFSGMIAARIERLRQNILDLSARNPLVSVSFSRGALVRVVDELPEKLFARLPNGLTFQPLPPLDAEPIDERSQTFEDALAVARLTDEAHSAAIQALGNEAGANLEGNSTIERDLRDRVRALLKLPPRPSGPQPSLEEHARLHGLEPSYDLPAPEAAGANPHHEDAYIQTLLLPNDLQRKLGGVADKARLWMQETGVNVMHMAIGFLEWRDPASAKSAFAPLLLLPVELSRKRTGDGVIFSVKSTDAPLAVNEVLRIKLANDYGVKLPELGDNAIELFLAEAGLLNPSTVKLAVRRQVAFGVFPSARIPMYHDLARIAETAGNHPALRRIFAGSEDSGANPFADDYSTDELEVARKAPPLVLDADGSQVSAVVDALRGEDLAIEGPPGSGKSQTIVNIIAAAIAAGKSVLFVAEKTAALEVVHSRLRAIDLDTFVLPLQASRGSKEAVMTALRERLNASAETLREDLAAKRRAYEAARDAMARYLDILSKPFGDTGLTIYTALGHAIGAKHRLQSAPALLALSVADPDRWSSERRARAAVLAQDYAKARLQAAPESMWRGVGLMPVHSYALDAKANEARQLADTATSVAQSVDRLGVGTGNMSDVAHFVSSAHTTLRALTESSSPAVIEAAVRAIRARSEPVMREFAQRCEQMQRAFTRLEEDLAEPEQDDWPTRLARVIELAVGLEATKLDTAAIEQSLAADREHWNAVRSAVESFDIAVAKVPELLERTVGEIAALRHLARTAGPEALALRDAVNLAPTSISLLARVAKQGADLVTKKQAISEAFERLPDPTPEDLGAAAACLKSAGLFARFGRPFQKAKALFLSYAKPGRFDRLAAAQALFTAADFKREADTFILDPAARAVFGVHWRQLETDFVHLSRLAEFCTGVYALFPELRDAAVRQTLCAASEEVLLGLPETSAEDARSKLSIFRDNARRAQQRAERGDTDLTLLAQGLDGFVRPATLTPEACAKLAELLASSRQLAVQLNGHRDAAAILGASFAGWRTPLDVLNALVATMRLLDESDARDALAGAIAAFGFATTQKAFTTLRPEVEGVLESIDRLAGEGGTPLAIRLRTLDLNALTAAAQTAASDREGLRAHAECALHLHELGSLGLSFLVPLIADIRQSEVALDLDAIIAKSMADAIYFAHGDELGRFPRSRLDALRATIAELDAQIQKLTRQEIRSSAIRNCRPPRGNGAGPVATHTDLALLTRLAGQVQPRVTPRDMVARAGRAMMALKPCWMMSPLAVAQYIPNDLIFDLCIIDEASQMTPEDSLGAIARAKQTVIVGDTNQLPPSSFFRSVVSSDPDDEDTEGEPVEEESILEMANAAFAKKRRLRWHYRSQHTSLIAFSNHHIYDDDLVLFPSADDRRPDRGVSLYHVGGLYKKGLNPIEAKAVVEAACQFMRDYPARSLGVVTMNQKQRELILEEMEIVAAKDEVVRAYIERWAAEEQGIQEFFVKNLENVQGDERDAIFISTVYGPESEGARVMRRFGPINGKVGRRRLNVLFTRAKQQIVTFTSLTPADIGVSPTENPGAYLLRRWLEYSATGAIEAGEPTGNATDSPFEDFVIEKIRAMGLEAVPQVGVRGYFVDIGVRHPDWPHGFVLGVECDGATYHSSRSARERDRLRQEILERLGWRLHRIWSTDWFTNQPAEVERLRRAIDARLEELRHRHPA